MTFSPLILSNISLRDRCLGGSSTTRVMMQHQVSAWVLTWCWYLVAVLITHQICDSCKYMRALLRNIKQNASSISWVWAGLQLRRVLSKGDTRKRLLCPVGVQFFLFVIRTWCIQVQNHSVLAPWKTLCCFVFFFFSKRFSFTTTQTQPPPSKKKKH